MSPTSVGALAANLGYVPTEPTWPADTSRESVPMEMFGKDHWSTFAYVETRTVDHSGLLSHDHMRCDGRRHPVMLHAKRITSADARGCPTRIKTSATPGTDGRFGVTDLPDHDDYDCLDDLIAAGLLQPQMPTVGPCGWYVDVYGRPVTAGAGDVIRPDFVTGLDEKVLATRAVWALTEKGHRIAGELRAFRANGGNWHSFVPTACSRCETTPADATCCSSHGKLLCHRCYRQTRFVEVCVAGCSACAAEGLPVKLSELQPAG